MLYLPAPFEGLLALSLPELELPITETPLATVAKWTQGRYSAPAPYILEVIGTRAPGMITFISFETALCSFSFPPRPRPAVRD